MHLNGKNLSHLFTVRLWFETRKNESHVTRIQVHHILSGNVRTFRDWSSIVNFMLTESETAVKPEHVEVERVNAIPLHTAGHPSPQFNTEEDEA